MFKQKVTSITFSTLLSVFFLLFLYSCQDDGPAKPDTTLKYPFYTTELKLPQSQSPLLLSEFLTSRHLDYHQFGYNFCASLINNNETLGFFIAIEYAEGGAYRGGVGFSQTEEDGYNWMGFTNTTVETTANPWSMTIVNPATSGSFVKIELTSGLMGSAGAVYKLTADVSDSKGKRLKVDVRLNDPYGAINQGYGTTSIYPHYLTAVQRTMVMTQPYRTIDEYLAATGDTMSWQGAYYYALPLMDVTQYLIEYDGKTLSGTIGKSWLDYFVKSYNAESIAMQDGAKWDWIAIQLPEINTAINVLDISSNVTGNLPFARLFNTEGGKTPNGAHNAAYSWGIDKIKIERIGEDWETPYHQKYKMKYRITLESATYPGELIVTMLRHNQAVSLPEGSNYQGLGIVTGTLKGQAVNGRCWVEVQPVGL
ncbi:MAG: hypothetical protein RO257_04765 [Candidatus Kapabacteria bacterium]|nr:hypothetical protein [Candidatus Kapabacteria bacterium]